MKSNHIQLKYHLEEARRKWQKNRERDRGNFLARTNNGLLKDSSVTLDPIKDTSSKKINCIGDK